MSWTAVQLAGSPESVFSAWQSLRKAAVTREPGRSEDGRRMPGRRPPVGLRPGALGNDGPPFPGTGGQAPEKTLQGIQLPLGQSQRLQDRRGFRE